MQALFVAPANGQYIFSARSDDYSRTFLSTDHTETNKQMIIDIPGYILEGLPPVNAAPKNLVSGRRYYLEMVGCQTYVDENFSVAVRLPDNTLVDPISDRHLESLP